MTTAAGPDLRRQGASPSPRPAASTEASRARAAAPFTPTGVGAACRQRPPGRRPAPAALLGQENTLWRGACPGKPSRRRPASRRRARNSSILMLAAFSPSVSAISWCDDPCA